jgi:hypothetical protein
MRRIKRGKDAGSPDSRRLSGLPRTQHPRRSAAARRAREGFEAGSQSDDDFEGEAGLVSPFESLFVSVVDDDDDDSDFDPSSLADAPRLRLP